MAHIESVDLDAKHIIDNGNQKHTGLNSQQCNITPSCINTHRGATEEESEGKDTYSESSLKGGKLVENVQDKKNETENNEFIGDGTVSNTSAKEKNPVGHASKSLATKSITCLDNIIPCIAGKCIIPSVFTSDVEENSQADSFQLSENNSRSTKSNFEAQEVENSVSNIFSDDYLDEEKDNLITKSPHAMSKDVERNNIISSSEFAPTCNERIGSPVADTNRSSNKCDFDFEFLTKVSSLSNVVVCKHLKSILEKLEGCNNNGKETFKKTTREMGVQCKMDMFDDAKCVDSLGNEKNLSKGRITPFRRNGYTLVAVKSDSLLYNDYTRFNVNVLEFSTINKDHMQSTKLKPVVCGKAVDDKIKSKVYIDKKRCEVKQKPKEQVDPNENKGKQKKDDNQDNRKKEQDEKHEAKSDDGDAYEDVDDSDYDNNLDKEDESDRALKGGDSLSSVDSDILKKSFLSASPIFRASPLRAVLDITNSCDPNGSDGEDHVKNGNRKQPQKYSSHPDHTAMQYKAKEYGRNAVSHMKQISEKNGILSKDVSANKSPSSRKYRTPLTTTQRYPQNDATTTQRYPNHNNVTTTKRHPNQNDVTTTQRYPNQNDVTTTQRYPNQNDVTSTRPTAIQNSKSPYGKLPTACTTPSSKGSKFLNRVQDLNTNTSPSRGIESRNIVNTMVKGDLGAEGVLNKEKDNENENRTTLANGEGFRSNINAEASKFIGEYLYELWKNECLCDVKIMAGSQSFLAHKIVLAAFSDVFCPSEPMPNPTLLVDVPNTSTNAVFQILQYLYTSEMKITDDSLEDILSAALFLGVTDVVDLVKDILSHPTRDNVLLYLEIADHMQMPCNMRDTPQLFREFIQDIWDSPIFKALSESDMILLLSDQAIKVDGETDLIVALVKWVESNKDSRAPLVPNLLKYINFVRIQPDALARTVSEYPHIFNNTECQAILAEVYKSFAILESGTGATYHHRQPSNRNVEEDDVEVEGVIRKSRKSAFHHKKSAFGDTDVDATLTAINDQFRMASLYPPYLRPRTSAAGKQICISESQNTRHTYAPKPSNTDNSGVPQADLDGDEEVLDDFELETDQEAVRASLSKRSSRYGTIRQSSRGPPANASKVSHFNIDDDFGAGGNRAMSRYDNGSRASMRASGSRQSAARPKRQSEFRISRQGVRASSVPRASMYRESSAPRGSEYRESSAPRLSSRESPNSRQSFQRGPSVARQSEYRESSVRQSEYRDPSLRQSLQRGSQSSRRSTHRGTLAGRQSEYRESSASRQREYRESSAPRQSEYRESMGPRESEYRESYGSPDGEYEELIDEELDEFSDPPEDDYRESAAPRQSEYRESSTPRPSEYRSSSPRASTNTRLTNRISSLPISSTRNLSCSIPQCRPSCLSPCYKPCSYTPSCCYKGSCSISPCSIRGTISPCSPSRCCPIGRPTLCAPCISPRTMSYNYSNSKMSAMTRPSVPASVSRIVRQSSQNDQNKSIIRLQNTSPTSEQNSDLSWNLRKSRAEIPVVLKNPSVHYD